CASEAGALASATANSW
nr:immunoglobulin heavy chain junction region [Macaca mulatta]